MTSSRRIHFHDLNHFLKELLDAVLGHEHMGDRDPEALGDGLPGEIFQREEAEGLPGDRFDFIKT